MDARHLFQLGTTDLGSGAAQTEGFLGWGASDLSPRAKETKTSQSPEQETAEPKALTAASAQAETRSAEHAREPSPAIPPDADDALRGNTEADHFIRKDGEVFAGTHLIIEVVDGDGLDDAERIEHAFRDCVSECGATLLHIHLHRFSPQGVSGVAVLAESHISVHTWPERRYGAFDVFMCGDADPHRAIDVLRRAFNAGDIRVQELRRGSGIVGV